MDALFAIRFAIRAFGQRGYRFAFLKLHALSSRYQTAKNPARFPARLPSRLASEKISRLRFPT